MLVHRNPRGKSLERWNRCLQQQRLCLGIMPLIDGYQCPEQGRNPAECGSLGNRHSIVLPRLQLEQSEKSTRSAEVPNARHRRVHSSVQFLLRSTFGIFRSRP